MKSLRAIASVCLASCFIVPASSAKVDPFIGEWTNFECGDAVCILYIKKKNKNYVVTFAAMRLGKVVCKASITMKRGPLSFTPGNSPPDTLSGTYGSEPLVYIEPDGTEVLFFTTSRCKNYEMGGTYIQEGH